MRAVRFTWSATLAAGFAVGAACAALLAAPQVRDLEQTTGLRWLFALRGSTAPPEQVVIVAMSRSAAAKISLPEDPAKFLRCEDVVVGVPPPGYQSLPPTPARWPRCLHAQLVNKLARAGAGVIAFDVLFRERPPLPASADGDPEAQQDRALAAAIESSGRVVVTRKLEVTDGRETLADLNPAIEDAALGSPPMLLVPDSRRRIDRFPTFTTSDPATATLPAVALQAYWRDDYAALVGLLAKHAGDLGQLLPPTFDGVRAAGDLQTTSMLMHRVFRADATLARRVRDDLGHSAPGNSDATRRLRALVSLYAGDDLRLLNFYGPAGTIRTIGYDAVLAATPETAASLFRGRAVLVGYAELDQQEQVEHFATPMSSASAPDLSGVEIAATALGNLVRDESIRQLPFGYSVAIVFIAGLVSVVVCRRFGYRAAFGATIGGLAIYGLVAYLEFVANHVWLPVIVPLLIAVPAGGLVSFTWKYWVARRQREELRRAFAYFVPRDVVSRLEQNAGEIGRTLESLECACVATDAANYTPLAETMSAEKLAEFLNRYYEALFGGVANGGGFVSDVVGDAMLAIWPNRAPDMRKRMLNALLEMRDAAERFGEQPEGNRLVTRFGVDLGRVALTTVGAGMHYEYRAVGDAVNTAARIQELNKKLGTRVLVSQSALGELPPDLLVRDLGRFLLRGKSNAVQIFELLGRRGVASEAELDLCARFAETIDAVRRGDYVQALERLRAVQARFPADGPTRFYLRALQAGFAMHEGALKPD